MAFRAAEDAQKSFDEACRYLLPRGFSEKLRREGEEVLSEITEHCGPVVNSYPIWHPLVPQRDPHQPWMTPHELTGYKNLDHNIYFVNGFVSCPYGPVDPGRFISDIEAMAFDELVSVSCELLSVKLYSEQAHAFWIRCDWERPLEATGQIPKNLAVPLMIECEMKGWRSSSVAESWDRMRPLVLGEPHGKRSSHFVSQETALALKQVYLAMASSGMYGS